MLTGPNVILALKVAVTAVTLILLASLLALARGQRRLHGRINVVFFILTVAALLVLEVVVRFLDPTIFNYFSADMRWHLRIHLGFALPSAVLLPVMLYTGWTGRRDLHVYLAGAFSVLWSGTFLTGLFLL